MASHFCESDSVTTECQKFTHLQYEQFCKAVENVQAKGINPGICSIGNSAAIMNNHDMYFNMVRPGIITYGYYPDQITKETYQIILPEDIEDKYDNLSKL